MSRTSISLAIVCAILGVCIFVWPTSVPPQPTPVVTPPPVASVPPPVVSTPPVPPVIEIPSPSIEIVPPPTAPVVIETEDEIGALRTAIETVERKLDKNDLEYFGRELDELDQIGK